MVEVTQVDIEAVKAFHNACARHILDILKDKNIGEALGENNTRHPIYQAFAAHRIAERERCARVADAHYAEIGNAAKHHLGEGNQDSLDRCHARMRSASQIAQAIRSGA